MDKYLSFDEQDMRIANYAKSTFPITGKGKPRRVEKKPGRNEPCTCGSEKKFKKCCGI